MYNILRYYPYRKVSNYLIEGFYRNYNREKLSEILDEEFNKKRLWVRDNSMGVSTSAISSIIALLILGEYPNKIPRDNIYYEISEEVASKMECSQNNRNYYTKLNVGGLEIILFGKPDILCGNLPGEVKAISLFSPEKSKEYQILKGVLQAEMYGFILGSKKAVLCLAYYRRKLDNRTNKKFHIERIKHEMIDVDEEDIKNSIKFIVLNIIVPYLY